MSHAGNFSTVPLTELFARGIVAQNNPRNPVVLVVDDEVVIADTLTTILAQNGIAAMTAYDGYGALEIARVIPPDLLLTDVVMPGISGIDTAIAIQKYVPDCTILLFSGQAATPGLLARAGRESCNFEVLLKPIHPAKLVKLIFERLHLEPTKQPCGRAPQGGDARLKATS